MSLPVQPNNSIVVRQATANNLQNIDINIPHNKLVVISGVSGSGKSSLAFDTVCREGQRRYLESFSTTARQLLGKVGAAEVESIHHLSPAIAIDQKTANGNPRSTVGTMSELNDLLRLLFARMGTPPQNNSDSLTRSMFSFNADGACSGCKGLGKTDQIDVDLLIENPNRTLREGALAITTDSGYIIYSQVTMDVLNDVCQAHDFDVDIPWCDLTDEQKKIILFGSKRIKIPFGKHTLESRMKWSGIKARPRQVGYYGGIIPVMEQILHKDRNKNILRFAKTAHCPQCEGRRLKPEALQVTFSNLNIAEFSAKNIADLADFFCVPLYLKSNNEALASISCEIQKRCEVLLDLGLGYLDLNRTAASLSAGEAQRIRLASVVGSQLQGMIYVLDEPSVGLHPRDSARLLRLLRKLVDQGNSVIVVEHDEATILAADWLIDIGPKAGKNGGQVLFEGPPDGLLVQSSAQTVSPSLTRKYLLLNETDFRSPGLNEDSEFLSIENLSRNNLKNFEAKFPTRALTVITGVSGAGKSSLLEEFFHRLKNSSPSRFNQLAVIDQSPIGRTPRSNPATYTKLFDAIRTLFAKQPEAKAAGLAKGKFSFNNKGGRCEECQGAGVLTVGMHFLGNVESPCPKCHGQRFLPEILNIKVQGKNISQILQMSIDEALDFFKAETKIFSQLEIMNSLGLGYLPLGQPSTTLSGGEAQRIKLAANLGKAKKSNTLYLFDEPTSGLHAADVENLIRALQMLTDNGATVLVCEHHSAIIKAAHWLLDLGPESGSAGGNLLFSGPPDQLYKTESSLTGTYLQATSDLLKPISNKTRGSAQVNCRPISLNSVTTNNLQGFDLEIPRNKITVISGISGSGKSSLALGTLSAEGQNRYAENFSTYMRQRLIGRKRPQLASSRGLTPCIAIGQKSASTNRRSTVATVSEIHPLLRLLMARFGVSKNQSITPSASHFSFNDHRGACSHCRGLGSTSVPDETKIISNSEKTIFEGAIDGHKTSRYYAEPDGQFIATLKEAAQQAGLNFSQPWHDLSPEARKLAMHGTGDKQYNVIWEYKRGDNLGTHNFHGTWPGFCELILQEYLQKHDDKRGHAMLSLMKQITCPDCQGSRLNPDALGYQFEGLDLAKLCSFSVQEAYDFFTQSQAPNQLRKELLSRLQTLMDLGLPYLNLDRCSNTLSSGESQRVKLARQLGARLQNITYVLDEPTVGLHPLDTAQLWHTLCRLRDAGNTIVMVEHDLDLIKKSDHVIDLGPGAGRQGGKIVAQGTPQAIIRNGNSPTGRALKSNRVLPAPLTSEFGSNASSAEPSISVISAQFNNLQRINVDFPTGKLTAVAGRSGSGKTSLVFGVLAASATQKLSSGCEKVRGLSSFDSIITVQRSSQNATSGSSPATVLGLMNPLRKMLSETKEAQAQNMTPKFFSTAQPGGRCQECKGQRQLTISLDFLSDVKKVCPSCQGKGFHNDVLECRLHGFNLPEILDLTMEEAATIFEQTPKLKKAFSLLSEVGLHYLRLGQETGTLSGGERQRLHLVKELLSGGKGTNLYLCDEPSAGLHEYDIELLHTLLRKLVLAGHTVIFTEHHQGMIARADHIIELKDGLVRSS